MRKGLLFSLVIFAVSFITFGFIGCRESGNIIINGGTNIEQGVEQHVHVFNEEIIAEEYKASSATCTQKATYYYSCVCGNTGKETFEHGETLPHVYNREKAWYEYLVHYETCTERATYYYSCKCGKAGDETFEYGELLPHVYCCEIAIEKYKASSATCTESATYYYSCECGKVGDEIFEYGETLPHVYDCKEATNRYRASHATCTEKATYYYSCACGACGQDTFEYGEYEHKYKIMRETEEYKASDATCEAYAEYYYSCECGAKRNEKYIYGELAHVWDGEFCALCGEPFYSRGLSYSLKDTGYSLVGIGSCTDTSIVIPSIYQGKPVIAINYTFYNCEMVTNIEVPDSVMSINMGAFEYCRGLKSITLPFVGATKDGDENTHFGYIFGADKYSNNDNCVPSSLETVVITGGSFIEKRAFQGCDSLESIKLPDTIEFIGDSAFNECRCLVSVNIPNKVKEIEIYTFYGCESLTSVEMGNSVMSIDSYAFYECPVLRSIELPNQISFIDHFAFCKSLTNIIFDGTIQQWTDVRKATYWDDVGSIRVICKDGEVVI